MNTLDLSQNEIDNSEEIFEKLIKNKNLSCLYLKATPLARGLKNYRKRLIAGLKKLKFLDDRPVLEQDHRLSEGKSVFMQPGFSEEHNTRNYKSRG